ncbi:MAG: N-6 DNA methylase [Paludibacteraceae bacterium]|nr:N-6 DNA methylase [Paludibacteraceae bacterium]
MFFQNSVIKKYLANLNPEQVNSAWEQYKAYFLNKEIQDNIRSSKEEQFQEGFLRELFVKVFGYTLNPSPNFNLITEQKNETDAKKADGAILRDDKVIGVIELKDHKTTDLSHVERQAFGYKSQHRDTRYVVISNFEKLRFYIDNAVEHIEWNLFTLSEDDFRLLYFCLAWQNISTDLPLKAKQESVSNEDQITQQLYKDYSAFKREIFADILKQNQPSLADKDYTLLLFRKTQKLLDRLLFIFFAEDCGLLPPNMILQIIGEWEQLKALDEYKPLYDRIKKYFGYLDSGNESKNIFAYNGGLFKPDEELDRLTISDELLARFTRKLSEYDYSTEVDVNILGHIFENSLNEIEEITAQINAGEMNQPNLADHVSKRKRDGVFYTPQYITKYIVENTVGRLCAEKKAEMGIDEGTMYDVQSTKAKRKELYERIKAYREWLLGITICDPACGSGAFLNAALQFLMAEHKLLDEMEAKITGSTIAFQAVENSILENNLYGVDINEESVEIARLALWLRTAKPHRKLNSLNNNIKCGNSLISDPAIAGDKAFNWQTEFPQVFAKGGFDIVIGNPPYGILIDDSLKDYYTKNFPLSRYKLNLYILFLERMFQIYKKGVVSFIIPKSLLINSYFEDIRRYILSNSEVRELFTITEKVFEDAEVGSSLIITFEIKSSIKENHLVRLANCEKTTDFRDGTNIVQNFVNQNILLQGEKAEIVIQSEDSDQIKSKIIKFPQAKTFYKFKNGLNPGNIKEKLITRIPGELTQKIIWGKEIKQYCIIWGGDYIIYDEHIADTLTINDIQSKKGMNQQTKIDFALRDKSLFEVEKLVIRKTGDRLVCSYDDQNYYFDTLVHGIYQVNAQYSLKYLLAILNSKPATYFYRCLHDIKGKVFAKISLDDLSCFPIPECADQQPFIDLADRMLSLNKDLQAKRARFLRRLQDNMPEMKITGALETFDTLDFAGFVAELKKQKIRLSLVQQDEWEDYFTRYKAALNELSDQIAATDREIDTRVYELYGLTEDEIKTILSDGYRS